MSDVLLQYAFPVSAVTPTPAADVSMLRNVLLVVKPKEAVPATIVEVTTSAGLTALTTNVDGVQLLAGGLTSISVLPTADLDIAAQINAALGDFYTIIVSSDFADEEVGDGTVSGAYATKKIEDITYTAVEKGVDGNSITITYVDDGTAGAETVGVITSAITVHMEAGVSIATQVLAAIAGDEDASALVGGVIDSGDTGDVQAAIGAQTLTGGIDADGADFGLFDGVIAHASDDATWLATFATDSKKIGFFTKTANGGKNMCFAFGKLLSGASWKNQQYIEMPFSDDVLTVGDADNLFDDNISFVLTSAQYGDRLAFFGNARAIVAPYVLKEIEILTQSAAVTYISANQPNYSIKEAILLEGALNKVVIPYITADIITSGNVTITLVAENFVANGAIVLAEPKALWRVVASLVSE